MATRGQLGGLSQAVPDAIRVLGAAGFELVFVETVGVGQMEVEIASAADTTLVVSIPGAGDAMQASKAGLLEIADVFVINKADRPDAHHVRRDLEAMLDFVETSDWRPPIIETVALEARGVSMLWTSIAEHRRYLEESGHLTTQRERRAQVELERVMTSLLLDRLRGRATGDDFAGAVARILAGETDPYCAAESLLP
jgi:LAO/AO transport system kinase